jgi:hypothetical protein
MKYTILLLLFSYAAWGQIIKLDFEPKRQVVRFYFDSLTIYTDTTSLFAVYEHDAKGFDAYDLRVKNLILQRFKESKTDTVTFSGDFIPFNDSIDNKYQNNWYVEWAILHLTKEKKLKIFDKHAQLVKIIVIKKIGSKKKGHIRRAFTNKVTKEELFDETLFMRIDEPSF